MTGKIVFEVGGKQRCFDRAEETLPVLRRLGASVEARTIALRDARLRMGRALLALREQVSPEEWAAFLESVGTNIRTLKAAAGEAERARPRPSE